MRGEVHGRTASCRTSLARVDSWVSAGLTWSSAVVTTGHLRKRRMLIASTGITSRKEHAIAEPRPWSLTPPNDIRRMARAMTFASSCTEPARRR